MQKKVLVICEMANNHMGDVDHGKKMITHYANTLSLYQDTFEFVWKFQFRDLETFIHKDYVNNKEHKYVKRFKETALSQEQFQELKTHAEESGFTTMCTPFDEPSVDTIQEMGFEYIKIASCSFTDWPLLNKVVKSKLPIVLSTAGVGFDDIDRVVSFLQHRNKEFTIMHCVGRYPTDHQDLQLNQIDLLKERYPNIAIGYSTHEHPTEYRAVGIAIGKGVVALEKHIALETDEYTPNAYSVTPDQMLLWIESAYRALKMCGSCDRSDPSDKELADLKQFKRGVFAKTDLKAGDRIASDDVYCAWPSENGQILANELSKYNRFETSVDIKKDEPIFQQTTNISSIRNDIWKIVQDIKSFLNKAQIVYPRHADLEISHHYGIENFYQTGIAMITVVNREYCKKLIIVLPNQKHPEQYHLKKEETFIVLHGDLKLELSSDNKSNEIHNLSAGDVITVEPTVKHIFSSDNGCVLEEVSSTHFVDDSYYTDPEISKNKNRKTFVSYWK